MEKLKQFFALTGGVQAAVEQANSDSVELMGDVRYRNRIKPSNRVLECKTEEDQSAAVCAGADIRSVYRNLLGSTIDEQHASVVRCVYEIEVFVPDHLDLNDFRDWWPKRPADLNSPVSIMGTTVNGRNIETLIDPTDHLLGSDTTALVAVMALLPMLSVIALMAGKVPVLGLPLVAVASTGIALCLYLIYSSEGMGRTIVCALLSAGVGFGAKFVTALSDMQMESTLVPLATMFGFAIVVLPVIMGINDTGADGGTFWSRYFASVKRVIKSGAIVLISSLFFTLPFFPSFFAIIPWIILACAYPLYYGQAEFREVQRTRASKGAVGSKKESPAAALALEGQTSDAILDKSPFLNFGTSAGPLADIMYKFGYAKGVPVGATIQDNRTHVLLWGKPGSGKTFFLRQQVFQLCAIGEGVVGILLNDGKGVLANEMRPMLDVVLEAGGEPVAPLENLGVMATLKALVESRGATAVNDENLWSNGANVHESRGITILRAIVDQEQRTIEAAKSKIIDVQSQVFFLLLQNRKHFLLHGADNPEIADQIHALHSSLRDYQNWANHERQWKWTPMHVDRILTMLGTIKFVRQDGSTEPVGAMSDETSALLKSHLGWSMDPADMELRLRTFPESIHPRTLVHSDLKTALKYFTVEWPSKDEKHRSSFELQVQADMAMFMDHGDLLVDKYGKSWNETETGFDVTKVCTGLKLGIYLPKTTFDKTGRLYQRLVKQKVYKAIFDRAPHGDDWMIKMPGQTLVVDVCDECQEVIGDLELQALPMTRSLGLWGMFATQQFEEFIKTYGSEANAKVLANTFATQISFKTSRETFDYLQDLMGEMKYRLVKEITGSNVSLTQVSNAYYESVYTDDEHPEAAYFGQLRHEGAARPFTTSELNEMQGVEKFHRRYGMSKSDKGFRIAGGSYGKMKHPVQIDNMPEFKDGPVLNNILWNENLAVRGRAFCMVNRAGVTRADYIDIPNLSEKVLNARYADLKKKWAAEKSKVVEHA